jgi:hypothetical protein
LLAVDQADQTMVTKTLDRVAAALEAHCGVKDILLHQVHMIFILVKAVAEVVLVITVVVLAEYKSQSVKMVQILGHLV